LGAFGALLAAVVFAASRAQHGGQQISLPDDRGIGIDPLAGITLARFPFMDGSFPACRPAIET